MPAATPVVARPGELLPSGVEDHPPGVLTAGSPAARPGRARLAVIGPRHEIEPGEGEGLGQVGLALQPVDRPPGRHLDDDVAPHPRRASRSSSSAQGCRRAPDQVLVLGLPPEPSARCRWTRRSPNASAIARASDPAVAVCERSSVTCSYGWPTGSQCGR